MRTALPTTGLPAVGSSVVKWADMVNGIPLTATEGPV